MDPTRLEEAAGAASAAFPRAFLAGLLPALGLLLAAPEFPAPESLSGHLHAQDVELLGRIHGTRPPQGYFDVRRADPGAFEFGRAWKNRTRLREEVGGGGSSSEEGVRRTSRTGVEAAAVTGLGRREAPVEGTFTFPVVLGLFADSTSTAPYSADEIQREYFTGPNSRYRTITEYYDEVSRGRVTLQGETFPWKRSELARDSVTGTNSALGNDSEIGAFIVDLIEQLDEDGVDWGRFDNDGPDGIPNTSDDDGFVDVLAVVHPTEGAECGNDGNATKVWSHRWQLRAALDGADAGPYETSTVSAATGEAVKIDDYVVVPVLQCDFDDEDDNDLNQIGVLAHELGHGFGLPDLYGTGGYFLGGAGNWGLMATGSWGCNASPLGQSADRPCHPGAWTKYVMGWVEVDTIPAGAEPRSVTLEPVESSGRVVRVETNDGSGEYFLLEYRDRQGFDEDLMEEGLLVWHVDPSKVDAEWSANRVNADSRHPGVWIRQADGLDDLMRVGGGRGDPGDPFPGIEQKREFHAGSRPSSFTHAGESSGVTITNISRGFSSLSFDLSSRHHTVTLRTEGTDADSTYFTVDGAVSSSPSPSFPSAPFERHVIEAATGDLIGEGVRVGFEEWEDGSSRIREFVTARSDTVLTASYGGRELQFAVEMTSPADTVTPGRIDLEPGTEDLWVPDGATVRVEAVARPGFEFTGWSGAFEGRSNPFMIDALEPLEAGAAFEVTYTVAGNPTRVQLAAAVEQQVLLQTQNGSEPVRWSLTQGALPEGLELRRDGTIIGAPLEDGDFPVTVTAQDAIGLRADLDLDVAVSRPAVGTRTLTAPFLLANGEPSSLVEDYMDWIGNQNGAYDVGDFRAFLRRHPDVPETVTTAAPPEPVIVPAIRLRGPEAPITDGGGP